MFNSLFAQYLFARIQFISSSGMASSVKLVANIPIPVFKNIKVIQLIWLMFSMTAIKFFSFKVTDIFITLSFHLIIYYRELDTMHLNAGRRKILVGYFNYQKPFPDFDIGSRLTMWLNGWLSSGWPWETEYHDLLEKSVPCY